MSKLIDLKALMSELSDLYNAQSVLGWDQQVYMPRGGAEDRGDILSTLATISHKKFVADETGELIEGAEHEIGGLDPDSDDARFVSITRHAYKKHTRVPICHVAEFSKLTTIAQTEWEKAKEASDFSIFQPHLKKIVAMRQEYSSFFKPYDHKYDPLLDDFEPGLKTKDVQEIFGHLRSEQVALIHDIQSRPQVDSSFLMLEYDEKSQWDFGVDVITHFGYDWQRGRQDRSVHPFTTTLGLGDVRITTRLDKKWLPMAMFGTMHECGHALYELGINPNYRRTPLADIKSSALHESQSRMWENLIGRSMPFWKFFYPKLQGIFPGQLGNLPLEIFYKGINRVAPSYIRVEADEATYNLHIMLRLELEIDLIEGNLAVKDLPDAWNTRLKEYLGLTPPRDAEGVLQDVHWSTGSFGYFPTYALGNLISVQLWECIQKQIPTLSEQIEHGEFTSLLEWLRTNIHTFGGKFEAQELVEKITGTRISPQPYIRYLRNKFGNIYI
jgi:carboxypeptidase Taq